MKYVFLSFLLLALQVHAQTYPSKPVKLVVPFPAGSATDQVARLTGQQLQEELKQPFVVENKPGAQGAIAAAEVAKATPDGYTLLVTTNTPQAANVSLFKKLAYDPVKDFAPIARIGTTSFMLMVRADDPARTLKEFLAQARAQPGKLSAGYGSSGSQVSLAMLKAMGKLDVVEASYKGIPQTVTDLLGGTLSFTFVDLGNALAQMKGGKLRGLAVTSAARTPLAPEVPAVAEELKGYELIAWFALMAPAGTPKEIVNLLSETALKAVKKKEIVDKFALIGTDVAPMNPEQLGKFIQSETARRRQDPRSHHGGHGPLRHADPCGSRRRRDQARAARRRRDAPERPDAHQGHGAHLHERQPQQAIGGARPEEGRGARGLPGDRARRRRDGLQHPAAGDGAPEALL
jgi:tripartite-type tricarboxylate transporter receptor subunit TctC